MFRFSKARSSSSKFSERLIRELSSLVVNIFQARNDDEDGGEKRIPIRRERGKLRCDVKPCVDITCRQKFPLSAVLQLSHKQE